MDHENDNKVVESVYLVLSDKKTIVLLITEKFIIEFQKLSNSRGVDSYDALVAYVLSNSEMVGVGDVNDGSVLDASWLSVEEHIKGELYIEPLLCDI